MAEVLEFISKEQQDHIAFVEWYSWNPLLRDLMFHIPNGERRPKNAIRKKNGQVIMVSLEGIKLKKMGVKKGVFDFFLPLPTQHYHGYWLELKRIKHGKPTPEQLDWQELMRGYGYAAEFAYGLDEAISLTEKYLSGL